MKKGLSLGAYELIRSRRAAEARHELDLLRKESADVPRLFDLALAAHGCSDKPRGQLKQDVFVLLQTKFKRGGFFVEFGATNGIDLSNTYLLETAFGWTGILAEPARVWHADLARNRTAAIEHDCVWTSTGAKLDFNMTNDGEFSTIDAFSEADLHASTRKTGEKYQVTTVSLTDMLERHNAPRHIDYLSIDTEGSEFEILNAFDFDLRRIDIITCEHNYTETGDRIHALLAGKGYERVLEGLSKWDHWYVRK